MFFTGVAVLLLAGCGISASEAPHSVQTVLAWDDSGDFGPQTAGTKTAGWQEALDYCVANGRDLYVKGGWGGRKAIYNVAETIHVPATQDFRIDGGVYVLNWTGAADDPAKDLMLIDSTMNGEYHFGIFVYGGAGAAMRIRPENPVPIDGFAVVVETLITSQGMADPAPFTPGERKAGWGLVLDGGKAAITCSRFDFIGGILNFKTCVETRGNFSLNHFDCLHLHTNAHKSTLFTLGPETTQNEFDFAIGVDQAEQVRGIDIAGRNNTFRIMTRGGFPRGNDILLGERAEGNRIDVTHGKEQFDAGDFITDHAEKATNRVTWVGAAPKMETIPVPQGGFVYTQRLYRASVRVHGEVVSSVKLLRGADALDLGMGAMAVLEPGDQLRIENAKPAVLEVLPGM